MMTEIIDAMPNLNGMDQQQLAQALVAQARSEGVELIGPGGLLTGLTKSVLETALEAELTEHLGYEQYDVAGRDSGNYRNGARTKTVFTPDRAGAGRGAPGSGRHASAGDREESATPAGSARAPCSSTPIQLPIPDLRSEASNSPATAELGDAGASELTNIRSILVGWGR